MIESMPFSDMRPFGEGSDKEEGIRWRSYHLDQLQSWKNSQVRLVKISVGVIMLTERFCPVLMLRPFKKHSANTTTQKIK